MVISVAGTAVVKVRDGDFRRRDRGGEGRDGDFRRRDRGEGRDGDFRRRDRGGEGRDGDFRRRDRGGEGRDGDFRRARGDRDGDFRRRDRGEGRDGDFRRRDRGEGRDGDFRRRDRGGEGRDGDFRRRDRGGEGRDGDFRRRDRGGEGRDGDFRRRDRGDGRDGGSRFAPIEMVVMTARRAPEVVGRDVKSLIQRVVGAEVVTSLARVRNQDRKSAKLLDPFAFAMAVILKLQNGIEDAEALFERASFNKRLLVMGVQRHVHR